MNVLFMVSWYFSIADPNPVGTFHTEQALELSKHCNIAVYYPYERNIKVPVCKNTELGLVTYRSKYKLEEKINNRKNMYKAMKQIIKEFSPDIIHGHVGTEAGRFAVMFGRLFGIPVMLTEHSSADLSGVRTFPHRQYAWMSYGGSRYNACVSDKLTTDLSGIFKNYKFHTIYNGIKIPEYIDDSVCYRVPDVVNMVLVASMYDRNIKGIPMLIPVLKRLKDDGRKYAMHFVGDGGFRKEFEELVRQNEISDVCIFHGRKQRPEVFAIVSQMDFLMSVSRFESFGCTMAESALMGTPILASDSGGSASIVNNNNGILLDDYSEDALYRGICAMMDSYGKYDRNVIKEDAVKRFDIREITAKYIDIYEMILANPRKKF